MSSVIQLISRSDAETKLGGNVRQLRNYEMELRLEEVTGQKFVISEWCPFNGVWCAWAEHMPIYQLRKMIEHSRKTNKAVTQYLTEVMEKRAAGTTKNKSEDELRDYMEIVTKEIRDKLAAWLPITHFAGVSPLEALHKQANQLNQALVFLQLEIDALHHCEVSGEAQEIKLPNAWAYEQKCRDLQQTIVSEAGRYLIMRLDIYAVEDATRVIRTEEGTAILLHLDPTTMLESHDEWTLPLPEEV
jgi:hypothetical protein